MNGERRNVGPNADILLFERSDCTYLLFQNNYMNPLNNIILQTILLGDSGVGKTSLLVQFDTGKFQTGTFSATVGIGFTVSDSSVLSNTVLPCVVSTTLFMLVQNERNCSTRLGLF